VLRLRGVTALLKRDNGERRELIEEREPGRKRFV
jgi:hypothetical protein